MQNSRLRTARYDSGFTLVELSIVVMIIGLVVAGVVGGQALVRQAKLKGISADINSFIIASESFRQQYNSLPGDLINMKSYFSICTDSGSNTCNGDGDTRIDNGGDDLAPYEDIRFWQHLSLAGLLQGNFSGLYVASQRHEPGVTVPVTPYGGNEIAYRVFYPETAGWAYGYKNNLFMLSKQGPNVSGTATNSVMNSVDAYSIDLKVDDGLAGSGNVLFGRGGESSLSGCVSIYWNGGSNPVLLAPMDTNITCRMAFKF